VLYCALQAVVRRGQKAPRPPAGDGP